MSETHYPPVCITRALERMYIIYLLDFHQRTTIICIMPPADAGRAISFHIIARARQRHGALIALALHFNGARRLIAPADTSANSAASPATDSIDGAVCFAQNWVERHSATGHMHVFHSNLCA